jgi:hypothetical protein
MSGTRLGEPSKPVAAVGGEGFPPARYRIGDFETMLDRLQGLLHRQLELVHQGSLEAAMELIDQTDRCVQWIADARMGDPADDPSPGGSGPDAKRTAPQWQGIERLYRELSLALTSQRTEVSAGLDAVRRGQRVLKTYGSHLPAT